VVDVTGETISHYEILDKLGGGGMGVVYRARDTRLGRTVALKFLPGLLSTDPEAKKRFMQEARAASSLDHPNICTVHDVGETDSGELYIVMAHYEGQTLKERLSEGPLPVELATNPPHAARPAASPQPSRRETAQREPVSGCHREGQQQRRQEQGERCHDHQRLPETPHRQDRRAAPDTEGGEIEGAGGEQGPDARRESPAGCSSEQQGQGELTGAGGREERGRLGRSRHQGRAGPAQKPSFDQQEKSQTSRRKEGQGGGGRHRQETSIGGLKKPPDSPWGLKKNA